MGISKVTRNCQVTIPKDVRMQLNVKEGDELLFVVEEGKVKLLKIENSILAAAGLWKDMKETGIEYQNRVRSGWKRRLKRIYDPSP